jgi:hypothetical protein
MVEGLGNRNVSSKTSDNIKISDATPHCWPPHVRALSLLHGCLHICFHNNISSTNTSGWEQGVPTTAPSARSRSTARHTLPLGGLMHAGRCSLVARASACRAATGPRAGRRALPCEHGKAAPAAAAHLPCCCRMRCFARSRIITRACHPSSGLSIEGFLISSRELTRFEWRNNI